jgi:hypothetical protein
MARKKVERYLSDSAAMPSAYLLKYASSIRLNVVGYRRRRKRAMPKRRVTNYRNPFPGAVRQQITFYCAIAKMIEHLVAGDPLLREGLLSSL